MQIISTKGHHAKQVKMLIYGNAGAGKTHFLGTGDNAKTLIISAESGLLTLNDKDIAVIEVKDWDELRQAVIFAKKSEFSIICLDSLTEVSAMLIRRLDPEEEQNQQPEIKQTKKNGFKLWGDFNKYITELIRYLRDMPDKHIVITALMEETLLETQMVKRPLMPAKKAKEMLPSYFDEVFYLDVNQQGERQLHTQPSESFIAKDRSGKLSPIETPNLTHIINKIKGEAQ